jgi:hypothetical protein
MARPTKKATEIQVVPPPDAIPAEGQQATATEQPPPLPEPAHTNGNGNGHPPNGNGNGNSRAARTPDVSWRLSSDRTTSIEVSAWVNEYTNQQTGEVYEQVTFTVQRSFRDQNNQWARGGSWRAHDIPILLFLLSKGHAWALERRTSDSSCPI